MMASPWNTLRRLFRETCGSDIVEAAVVLPMLFMAIIGIFWFGQAFRIYGAATHAAMEGARAAVAPTCTTCGTPLTVTQIDTNAVTAVNAALTASNLNPAQLKPAGPTWNPPTLCPCGSTSSSCGGAAVSCDPSVSGSNVCVQRNVQLSYTTVSGGAGSCGTSVSLGYQYPFHFALPCWPQPCTSLDLNTLTLKAQAQMRVETQ